MHVNGTFQKGGAPRVVTDLTLACLLCGADDARRLGGGLSDCSDGGGSTSGTRTTDKLGCVGA